MEVNGGKVEVDSTDHDLPQRSKGLKDQFCLLIFAVTLLLVVVFSGYAFRKCIPSRNFRGIDSWGNVCGGSASTVTEFANISNSGKLKSEFPYLWTTFFMEDTCGPSAESAKDIDKICNKICVKACPEINNSTDFNEEMCLKIYQVNDYDWASTNIINLCNRFTKRERSEDCDGNTNHSQTIISGRCFPQAIVEDNYVTIETYMNEWHYILTDLITSIDIICTSVGLAMAGCVFSCISIIRYPKYAYLHFTVWCLFVTLSSSSYLVYKTWIEFWKPWKSGNVFTQPFYIAALSSCFSCTCLLVLTLVAWLKKSLHRKAIGFMIESSRCLKFIPKLLSQPIWTFFLVGNTTLYFTMIVMYTLNCFGLEPTVDGSRVIPSSTSELVHFQGIFVFGLISVYLWCLNILKAGQETLICGAVYQWYFAKNKQKVTHPISRSTKLLLKYNIGSIVACSFSSSFLHTLLLNFKFKKSEVAPTPSEIKSRNKVKSFKAYFSPYAPAAIGIHGAVEVTCLCKYDDPSFAIESELPTMRSLCNVQLSRMFKPGEKSLNVGQTLYKSHKAARWCIRATHMSYLCFSLAIFNLVLGSKTTKVYIVCLPALLLFLASYFSCGLILSVMTSVVDAIALCFHHDLNHNNGHDKQYYSSRDFVNRITGAKLAETATFCGINRIKRKEQIRNKLKIQEDELRKREKEISQKYRFIPNHQIKLQRIPKSTATRLNTGLTVHRSRSRIGLDEKSVAELSNKTAGNYEITETHDRQYDDDVTDILNTEVAEFQTILKDNTTSKRSRYDVSTKIRKTSDENKSDSDHSPLPIDKKDISATAPPNSKENEMITFESGQKSTSMWNKLFRGVKAVAPAQVARYNKPPILIKSVRPDTDDDVSSEEDSDDEIYESKLWKEDIW